ncbi:prolyl oligopeptidase family serine peptidase [Sphingomonas sp. LaA6.9]|uniref:S9 family peptidase n=1 Tax=Sphingomonas sp. LaA6.9 TaxID=2919914 RepID=UPI001F4FC78C|nr:prolyl oligopeptidase family serine peptidase [Sphingomonas sp. LaA6.9]MCJ8156783.1 prolyl oligopeptidase family serine peptidase [Sphingomonas sp. LaA6.9]
MRTMKLAFATAALLAAPALLAQTGDDTGFLEFPIATDVSNADVPAFAWLVRQGENSTLMFARTPDFKPVKLFAQADVDGQPITSVSLSPDGRFVAFQTGVPFGGSGEGFNPASLVEAPKPTLWVMATDAGAKPVRIGVGFSPRFAPDGKRMLYRQGRDLWAVDLADPSAKPAMLVPGGAAFGQGVWAKDGKSIIFAQDRGGWSFLGRFTLGEDRIHWLVTGADRLSSPVLSPDGASVAYLRWPGRQHTVTYDLTENQPFAVETVDLASGQVRTLYEATGKSGSQLSDDPEGDLRWADDRNIVFRSEHDGWARLYAVARGGGTPRALTPANCEVAESELAGADTLFVVHNCRDIDTRQLSSITVSSGREREIASRDVVMGLAGAVGDGRYVAFTGGNAEDAPLLRVLDLKSGKLALAEKPTDYGYAHHFSAPAPQVVRIKASDGGTVPAQLFLPSKPGPHPALVYVHGGPPRQMFPAFHFGSYYASDFAVNRHLAELGYVVVSINYRSGVGYGRAFREAPERAWRGASEYNDVLGTGRWLAQRDDVDAKRIGIWGGSYGGLLTAQALARNSDVFAAGIAVHGVYDWSWPSPTPGHQNPSRLFGVSEADKPLAFRSSPLGAIAGWTSPVLLVSGDRDMNVDVLETVDLHQKLRAKGVDVRTVIIPGEAHDMIRHSSWLELWGESRRFLQEKLGK